MALPRAPMPAPSRFLFIVDLRKEMREPTSSTYLIAQRMKVLIRVLIHSVLFEDPH